jgi:hypothetical protein
MPFLRWYCLGAGCFVVGMAYGCWAAGQDGRMSLGMELFIGALGIALAATALPFAWRDQKSQ